MDLEKPSFEDWDLMEKIVDLPPTLPGTKAKLVQKELEKLLRMDANLEWQLVLAQSQSRWGRKHAPPLPSFQ